MGTGENEGIAPLITLATRRVVRVRRRIPRRFSSPRIVCRNPRGGCVTPPLPPPDRSACNGPGMSPSAAAASSCFLRCQYRIIETTMMAPTTASANANGRASSSNMTTATSTETSATGPNHYPLVCSYPPPSLRPRQPRNRNLEPQGRRSFLQVCQQFWIALARQLHRNLWYGAEPDENSCGLIKGFDVRVCVYTVEDRPGTNAGC